MAERFYPLNWWTRGVGFNSPVALVDLAVRSFNGFPRSSRKYGIGSLRKILTESLSLQSEDPPVVNRTYAYNPSQPSSTKVQYFASLLQVDSNLHRNSIQRRLYRITRRFRNPTHDPFRRILSRLNSTSEEYYVCVCSPAQMKKYIISHTQFIYTYTPPKKYSST